MKIIAYVCLHYGKAYLGYAIQSVIDRVDELHVLYSATPSHGTSVSMPCPESKQELVAIALAAAGSKLKWHDVQAQYEGQQRDLIYHFAPDADVIITLDSDEVWTAQTWAMLDSEMNYKGYQILVPFVHYWRSFYKAITNDAAAPARVTFPHGDRALKLNAGLQHAIQHFGYAQEPKITYYKSLIHGHRSEWRPEWFETKFMPNAQVDVHPTNVNYWNTEDVNPDELLPEFMRNHPYYHKALIE